MDLLIFAVLLTLFISANCSIYEAVLYSTRLGTLEAAKSNPKKKKNAAILLDMKQNISKPIAAILIMNTIANTAGATITGMYASDIMNHKMVILFSIGFTIAILFCSEIIPKTIGAVYWRTIWPFVIYPLKFLQALLMPIIYITQFVTKKILGNNKEKTFTEEEILAMVKLGAKEGEISHQESGFVNNLINLEERKISEIMTPRTVVFSLDENLPIKQSISESEGKGHTRIPVYENEKENITGYVLMSELYYYNKIKMGKKSLSDIKRNIKYFDTSTNCLIMLNYFLKHRTQIAVITDEFGGIAGLVTLEDIMETVFGIEIVDETDTTVDMQSRAKKNAQKKKF